MSQDEIDDIRYTTIFSVVVGKENIPTKIKLAYVMDFTADSLMSDYQPSSKFVSESIKQIEKCDWYCVKDENGKPKEQSAYCYVLKSNPDTPICSNNMER